MQNSKMSQENVELIDLEKIIKDKAPGLYRKIPKFLLAYLKRKIHQDELNEILTLYADKDGVDFMQSCVDYFHLELRVNGLDELDESGRYVFVSNHPLGGLDGICLSAVVGNKFAKKIKYPVNDFLLYLKNLKSIFVPINKHGAQSRHAANLMNEVFLSDNQIITFPAGLCSRKVKGEIVDLEWKKMFVLKAIESKRNVVPVYFEAANSNFFYKFAKIRKCLGVKFNFEMLFLPDEMFKNKNKVFKITFGTPISWRFFDDSKSPAQWAQDVKDVVYSMRTIEK